MGMRFYFRDIENMKYDVIMVIFANPFSAFTMLVAD